MIDLGEFQVLVAATKLAASDLRVSGNSTVGGLVKAAYRLGSGTIQFTRAPDAGGPAVDFGAVVASGSTYTIQLSDRGYVIGARPITYLPGAAVGVQVPITAPLAPTMGAASAGNGSVSTTFTAPGDNGGSAITGYVVYAYRAADDYQLGLATGAASPININGLPNGVAMYSKVAAQNVKGTGPQSNASLVVTPSASVSRVFGNRTRSPMASASVGASLEQGNWIYLGYCPFVPYGWKARFPLHWTNAANLESAAPNNITHRGWWIAHSATKDINTTTRVRGTVAGSTNAITYDPTVNSVGFVTDLLATNGDIPAGHHIWIMNAYAVPSGGAVPANYDFGPNSTLEGSVGSAATSQVATLNSGVLPATGANGVGGQWNASTVECYGNDGKVILVFGGDSVGEGQNETSFTQTDGVFGFISRGMAMGTPMSCANMCIPGSSLGYWVDTGRVAVAKKLDLLQMGTPVGFDSLVSQHSTNGFGSGGTSAANIEAKYRAYIALLKAEFPGKPIHQVGIVCKASATTDGLSTAANQTAAYARANGEWIAKEAKIESAAVRQAAADTKKAREETAALQLKFDQLGDVQQKARIDHENDIRIAIAGVLAGTERLSIPTAAGSGGALSEAGAIEGAATGAGATPEARADILPGTAATILRIAGDYGQLVRDYNAVLERFDTARASCNAE
jgi:hypothetical protein